MKVSGDAPGDARNITLALLGEISIAVKIEENTKRNTKRRGFLYFLSRPFALREQRMGLVWARAGAVTHQDKLVAIFGRANKTFATFGSCPKKHCTRFEYIEARILHKNMNEHIFSVVKNILRTSSARNTRKYFKRSCNFLFYYVDNFLLCQQT